MKRTFIAIHIKPDAMLLDAITSIKEHTADSKINWARIDGLHVTLAFIGATSPEDEASVRTILSNISKKYSAFDINVRGIGVFGKNKQKILWLGIEDSHRMLSPIADDIKEQLASSHIQLDPKPLNPHLTLGRIKEYRNDTIELLLKNYSEKYFQKVTVGEVILFHSISIAGEVPTYLPIGRYELNSK